MHTVTIQILLLVPPLPPQAVLIFFFLFFPMPLSKVRLPFTAPFELKITDHGWVNSAITRCSICHKVHLLVHFLCKTGCAGCVGSSDFLIGSGYIKNNDNQSTSGVHDRTVFVLCQVCEKTIDSFKCSRKSFLLLFLVIMPAFPV